MAKAKLKEKTRTLFKRLKKNILYLVTIFFLFLINALLIKYHYDTKNFIIAIVHVTLALLTFAVSIYLNKYKHARSHHVNQIRTNQIYNIKTLANTIDMQDGDKMEICSRNVDLDNAAELPRSIFEPPTYANKVHRARKRLVYFTKETSLVNVKWCSTCKNYRSPMTLHCSNCGVCVHNFDHHCIWLNNCINKDNYRLFVLYVMLMLANCYFGVFSVADLFFVSRRIKKVHLGVFFGVLSLVIVLGAVFTSVLVGFHLYLRWKRLSTYQFVRLKYADKPSNNTIFYSEKRMLKTVN